MLISVIVHLFCIHRYDIYAPNFQKLQTEYDKSLKDDKSFYSSKQYRPSSQVYIP